ncbi:zinc-binding dehydrogenase [Levilactobacillus namurensis]|uniref:zinc-binding dehydrogenase n=1 Tax=Levilactobacillus namurensis TaxID=380393 RepID=UPI00222FD9BC|nr:zinc-binding dehydrogenase [Levilactobacillus namurensis]MCW3777523.1 zinc-binding dehydrogenase [Levilactobacillus namurensis]MDT7018723.1 zinc-binding dehydrogenase [Levilactobacillus namurensis]WNN66654.1 zinc-binding dehydrogenase [Levilactobacillus namurensis]
MRGWRFTDTNVPLKLVEQPDPEPADDEVVIAVKAAGLCHTDVGILHDPNWLPLIKAPVILGHECAGQIIKVGANVKDYQIGDRVGVSPQNPETGQTIGCMRDGGYSDMAAVPANQLMPLPDGVSYVQGASATDAGMSSYHPLFVTGQAKPGMKVGIIGIGGLGEFAVNMAVIAGCKVYAVDTKASARQWAEKIGVEAAYADIADLKDQDIDLIIDFAGFDTTTNEAAKAVKAGGTVVVVGMGILHSTIDTGNLITRNVTLVGNSGGTPEDIANVYKYFQTGKMHPDLPTTTFDKIPEGLVSLEKGEVVGRLIASRD